MCVCAKQRVCVCVSRAVGLCWYPCLDSATQEIYNYNNRRLPDACGAPFHQYVLLTPSNSPGSISNGAWILRSAFLCALLLVLAAAPLVVG